VAFATHVNGADKRHRSPYCSRGLRLGQPRPRDLRVGCRSGAGRTFATLSVAERVLIAGNLALANAVVRRAASKAGASPTA